MKKSLFETFKRIGGFRLNESVLGELPSSKLMKMKSNPLKEAPMPVPPRYGGPGSAGTKLPEPPEPLDIEYFSDQLNKIYTQLEEFHQELGTNIEMKQEETGNYEYEVIEKQIGRYMSGAIKQIDSLQKYLERQKGKGL